jgi:aubergine-like protein
MKEMAQITNTDARRRVQECKSLIESFGKSEKCKEAMQEWQMCIESDPIQIQGQKLAAGKMIMGKVSEQERSSFDIETCQDIDRKIQAKMYAQPDLKRWGIFYCENDRRTAVQFIETMQKCTETFHYQVSKPREFAMRTNRFDDWQREIKQSVNSSVQMLVLLLPGQKNKAPLYDDLKRLLITEIPVPSQVVLVNTISKGKNVRSICNKILIQICAKIGGEPWTISNMPLMNKPTMICGMDTFHKQGTGSKSILAFTASLNKEVTNYYSSAKIQDEGQELSNTLQKIVSEALTAFKNKNGVYPMQVVIYRDGVGDSQQRAVLMYELPQVKEAIK